MMNQFTPVDTIMYRGHHIDIFPDLDSPNPADEFDNYSDDEIQSWRDGEVYGFVVRETGDSVWGFYGWHDATSPDGGVMWYATNSIDCHLTARSNAIAQLDAFDAAPIIEQEV
jgi:hypothetical protein